MKAKHPDMAVSDIAKELGKRWEACSNRTKYDEMAKRDKERYVYLPVEKNDTD